ncbi:SRPBCC family protein [Dactylosporangium sp. NPDC000555]|uniref:SRPBCC family protein n=1 Tax=Dactylosporangium sp. NPDC000555 TaxID=3154260 RepID=UPI003319E0C8
MGERAELIGQRKQGGTAEHNGKRVRSGYQRRCRVNRLHCRAVSQFESFPQFMSGVESIRQVDDRRTHWVTKIGGVRREFDAEITEQQPDQRIAWSSVGGDTRHAGVVSFQPLGERDTRVTVQLDWQPEGIAEKAGSAVGVDELQVKADTRRFKEFIEQRGNATGAWRGDIPRRDR